MSLLQKLRKTGKEKLYPLKSSVKNSYSEKQNQNETSWIQQLLQEAAAVQRWSSTHRGRSIPAGFAIVEVNGQEDTEPMMEALRSSTAVEMLGRFYGFGRLNQKKYIKQKDNRRQQPPLHPRRTEIRDRYFCTRTQKPF